MGARARELLDSADIDRVLTRIAHEIVERAKGSDDLVILGIRTRGAPLARRIARKIGEIEGAPVPVGAIDITMYRDDLRLRPARAVGATDLPPDAGIDDKTVVLVDDVLFSGRTVRAALDALGELGRPKRVRLAVLIDRGHRQLPIRADHVGKNVPTSAREKVQVRLFEIDGVDSVTLESGESKPPGPSPDPLDAA